MKGTVRIDTVLPILQQVISQTIHVVSFHPMKSGMTNDSYLFKCDEGQFILRLPGKGSEALINRQHEHRVYQLIEGRELSDELIYFDPDSGVMITRFIPTARVCDPKNKDDLKKFIDIIKRFHGMRLEVEHYFDPWERLEYYESLWGGQPSRYLNYPETKKTIQAIYQWTLEQPRDIILSHIDAVADNVLIDEYDQTYLIDWEYAAMQDKDIDIAMFAVYSLLTKEEIDYLIDLYQGGEKDILQKKKIYAYIAIMGLVWSNWCEFQAIQGQDLGEYATGQYQFALDFSQHFDNLEIETIE